MDDAVQICADQNQIIDCLKNAKYIHSHVVWADDFVASQKEHIKGIWRAFIHGCYNDIDERRAMYENNSADFGRGIEKADEIFICAEKQRGVLANNFPFIKDKIRYSWNGIEDRGLRAKFDATKPINLVFIARGDYSKGWKR